MRLEYVEPGELTLQDWERLFTSCAKGGCPTRVATEEIVQKRWRVFRFTGGILAVSALDGVMTIEAVWARRFGWGVRGLRWALVELARHYKCYKAQTFCYDERLAAAMLRVGGVVSGWQFSWDTKEEGAGDGHN